MREQMERKSKTFDRKGRYGMTTEEAIVALQCLIDSNILKTCNEYKNIKEAIERQIPKQPRYQNREWQCPCCKKWNPVTYSPWYCPDCSQAIDWAGEELEEN